MDIIKLNFLLSGKMYYLILVIEENITIYSTKFMDVK
jgi:hypothetical protein